MKPGLAVPLLFVASLTVSCAAQREPPVAVGAARPTEPATHAPIVLGDREGRLQLTFPTDGSRMGGISAVQLRAYDEILLGPNETMRGAGKTDRTEPDSLWLDNRLIRAAGTNAFWPVERCSSNEWEYASVDLVSGYGSVFKQFKRHLLYVQPDLFVICDEIIPLLPSAIDIALWIPQSSDFDPARDEWRVQSGKAGLTIRLFGSPRAARRSWVTSDVVNSVGTRVEALKCLRAGVTNQIIEFRQITVLVPHEKDRARSVAFKLLESETAIGVRVHRDGLPTLIAFRKNAVAGEANLTGLKFTGPIAVDVFHPRRKQVVVPQ